jgi:hypothetical protein
MENRCKTLVLIDVSNNDKDTIQSNEDYEVFVRDSIIAIIKLQNVHAHDLETKINSLPFQTRRSVLKVFSNPTFLTTGTNYYLTG